VDDGFAYAVPEGMDVEVGAVVRVPLGGRRLRGWVVAVGEPPRPRLRPILARSGDLPVFDAALLGVLRWAAIHYVAPLAAVLARPPTTPRGAPAPPRGHRRRPPLVGPAWTRRSQLRLPVAATDARPSSWRPQPPRPGEAAALSARLGIEVPAVSSQRGGAAATAAWVRLATEPGMVVAGTRELAAWPMAAPGLAVLVGEGRRGMKDKATPTIHARELLLRRAAAERFSVVMTELVPTAEALSRSGSVEAMGRPWGLVDLVDRRPDQPGSGLIAAATAAVLRAVGGRRVLLFTHRRTAAQRCVRCRVLRRCQSCGAAPGDAVTCPRCGAATAACSSCGGRRFEALGAAVPRVLAEVSRIVSRDKVGVAGSGCQFIVGTERDLPGLQVDLTVILDGDGPLLAPSYRAAEDGLRLLGRAVATAGSGRGRRGLVQTADHDNPVLRALRDGAPVPLVRSDAARRASLGFPPGGEIIVVEATGTVDPAELVAALADRAEVHGPAAMPGGSRWLIQGRDLGAARVVLRDLVGRWRESGVRVRVDADRGSLKRRDGSQLAIYGIASPW
jgi:primosomal protein N' (replication factor Y)